VVVLASGNLGLVSFTGTDRRLTMEDITLLHPDLIPTLVEHPGIALVVVATDDRGPVAIGRGGVHGLRDGDVAGDDPLAPYGPNAARLVLEASTFRNAPDLYVLSAWWPDSGEVAAFENLVGSHGGLGGRQTQPFLLRPADLPLQPEPVVGAAAMYRILKGWVTGSRPDEGDRHA
jgi:hypothetical protein